MTLPHPETLLTQFHDNQSLWLARLATGQTYPQLPHNRLLETEGALTVMPGRAGVMMLPMEFREDVCTRTHDPALAWLRHNRARDVLVWSMKPDADLDLELLAQGYRPGFEPWWMSRDLDTPIPRPKHQIRAATDDLIAQLARSDIPYIIPEQLPAIRELISSRFREVEWLVAFDGHKPVGHALVNLADEHAGLFNVGVSPRHRFRGVGTSLTLAAMQIAQDHGALTMNLNSTPAGKTLYERAGFTQIGVGQTWVRSGPAVYRDASHYEQRVAHAIGRGDVANLGDTFFINELECGLSLQEFATRYGQREMLLHLIERGHTPDIIALWRLDLREEALAATRNEYAREVISGTARAYPIHHAVQMGAGSLVLALIEAGASLSVRDGEYNATPLDWAHANNKPTIARIIRQAGGR